MILRKKKFIPLPKKYNWDIDIKAQNNTLSIDGTSHVIHKIFNSGNIIGGFVPLYPKGKETIGQPVLLRDGGQYFIKSRPEKEAIFEFLTKFDEDKKVFSNPPVGTTIIIEGKVSKESRESKEIIPGLQISSLAKTISSHPFEFRIVLIKDENHFKLCHFTTGVQPTQMKDSQGALETIMLFPFKIYDLYTFKRLRIKTLPVSDDEIKYL